MSWKLIEKTKKLLDQETGAYYKNRRDVAVVLVYPNTYYLGMSNLGFQTIYQLLNKRDDTWCERSFKPEKEELREFLKSKTTLFSLESQRPLNEFDIIAFSLPFELDYFNILPILDLAKIPLLSRDRDKSYPLIIAGGTAVTANPKPLSSFMDIFIIGEGEEVVNEVVDSYLISRDLPKEKILFNLNQIPGVYVPSSGQKEFSKRHIPFLDLYPTNSCIITKNTEFSNMFLIELTRGCPQMCKFCLASHLYKPFRYRSLNVILSQVEEGLKYTKRLGLVGGAISNHPDLQEICQKIKELGGEVSLSSLRIQAITKELLKTLNQKTITIAPEAGSPGLRQLINKPISDEKIIEKIELLNSHLPLTLKLYFMLGIPTETQEDIKALITLISNIKASFKGRLVISINPFIPKLSTPFQGMEMIDKDSFNSKLKNIRKNLQRIEIISESIKSSLIQWHLSVGDEKMGELIYLSR
ncbi:MAG: radical SAM protein [bacterium]